jgi:5-methylcytosine-specific restriction protein A
VPSKPMRPCRVFGCPNISKTGYCAEHAYLEEQERKARQKYIKSTRRDKKEQAFYTSGQWRTVRQIKLNRDPLCEECLKQGITTIATEVHHIEDIKSGGAKLRYDNLMSLCKSCHSSLTARGEAGSNLRREKI